MVVNYDENTKQITFVDDETTYVKLVKNPSDLNELLYKTIVELTGGTYTELTEEEEDGGEKEGGDSEGTIDNPIEYVQNETILTAGLYYTESGVKYLCSVTQSEAIDSTLADYVLTEEGAKVVAVVD